MLNKILQKIEGYRFSATVKKINTTMPIEYVYDERVTILSMVGHNAVSMYLVAIKSFMNQFGYGSIEVINDGSLTASDINLLQHHVPRLAISQAQEVNTYNCPSYISWKRLFRIVELVKTSYVIQLDSDIVVTGPMLEINSKVQKNSGFVIGSNQWSEPVDTEYLHAIIKQWTSKHVQPSAELHFKDLNFFKPNIKYLRGCAGFCGYPRQSFNENDIIQLSLEIEEKIGKDKWKQWGSEQVTTLCLISKSFESSVLPWPKYQNYRFPETNEPQSSMALIHFIGTNRFTSSCYRTLCSSFISKIK
ncbi:MAG: hypothetical protein ACK5MF_07220 [Vibrio sp.]|uniref:hypothetical protein n=1 Tax=Vibrio sp. TaxID=678 RepID=UPI003A84F97C